MWDIGHESVQFESKRNGEGASARWNLVALQLLGQRGGGRRTEALLVVKQELEYDVLCGGGVVETCGGRGDSGAERSSWEFTLDFVSLVFVLWDGYGTGAVEPGAHPEYQLPFKSTAALDSQCRHRASLSDSTTQRSRHFNFLDTASTERARANKSHAWCAIQFSPFFPGLAGAGCAAADFFV